MTDDDAERIRRSLERLPDRMETLLRAKLGNLRVVADLGVGPRRKGCPHCGLPQ